MPALVWSRLLEVYAGSLHWSSSLSHVDTCWQSDGLASAVPTAFAAPAAAVTAQGPRLCDLELGSSCIGGTIAGSGRETPGTRKQR